MEIQGYPNYLIYRDGKVWSKKTNKYLKPQKTGKFYKIGKGYLSVNIDRLQIKVHRLVAIHYLLNPDNKPQVDHLNRDTYDNRVENLRWVSNSENQQNTTMRKDNTTGHKNISYDKTKDRYIYTKTIRSITIQKQFKTLKEALCYKFILILKVKAKIPVNEININYKKNISFDRNRYNFGKTINKIRYRKYFKTLKEALCYKYIFTLKMRAGLV